MRTAGIERVGANNEMVPYAPSTGRWIHYWPARSLLVLLILATVVLFISGGAWLWLTTPDVGWLRTTNPHTTAMMRQREEEQRAAGQVDPSRLEWVGLAQISPYLIQSVVEAEDARFFDHRGFDGKTYGRRSSPTSGSADLP